MVLAARVVPVARHVPEARGHDHHVGTEVWLRSQLVYDALHVLTVALRYEVEEADLALKMDHDGDGILNNGIMLMRRKAEREK